MNLSELLQILSDNSVKIAIKEGRLLIADEAGFLTSEMRQMLREHKEQLITLYSMQDQGNDLQDITIVSRDEPIPASFVQQRIWFLDQLEQGSGQFNSPLLFKISGDLAHHHLKLAVQMLVERHEALRTNFAENKEGQVLQLIRQRVDVPWEECDFTDTGEDAANQLAEAVLLDEVKKPFDLAQDVLLRVVLIRLGEQQCILSLNAHHIARDGISDEVLLEELSQIYAALVQEETAPLAEPRLQFADFSCWQRKLLDSGKVSAQLDFWCKKLEGIPKLHSLPLDSARPAVQSFDGAFLRDTFSQDLTSDIRRFCQSESATLFIYLQTVFSVLISRYSGQSDVVMGTSVSGRFHQDLQRVVGCFLNMLALRTDVDQNLSFRQLLEVNKRSVLDGFANQQLPYEMIVERLNPERSLSYSPVFQILFIVQDARDKKQEQVSQSFGSMETQIEPIVQEYHNTKYDLELYVIERDEQISIEWLYNTEIFHCDTVKQFASSFKHLVHLFVQGSDKPLYELDLLSQSEREKLHSISFCDEKHSFEDSMSLGERVGCIHHEDKGVREGELFLSYADLNQQSDKVAGYLQGQGLSAGSRVGVYLPRCVEMTVAMVGILKAGCTYVPLDASYPLERLRYMVSDSGVSLVLSTKGQLSQGVALDVVSVALDDEAGLAGAEYHREARNVDEAAVLIYTSGSTGQPKGVLLSHRSILNRLYWMESSYPFLDEEVCAQKTALNFVDHVAEVFQALCFGRDLVVIGQDTLLSGEGLLACLRTEGIGRLTVVPSLLSSVMLSEEFCAGGADLALRYVISSGEVLPQSVASRFKAAFPEVVLLNVYGSTEVGADATCGEYCLGDEQVSIGRGISNMQVYVMDAEGGLLPPGASGELYVGGEGLALGYVDDEQGGFITHETYGRLYRTGDWGRWLSDGRLGYEGRLDGQIKLRGFRIEPGEIVSALKSVPGVLDGAVRLHEEEGAGISRLVGYLVLPASEREKEGSQEAWSAQAQGDLKSRLPGYMVPSVYVMLSALPLTPGGKLDEQGLEAPALEDLQGEYVGPGNETERVLCGIWESLLHHEPVGVHDNFFSLGGDSILSVQLVSRIKEAGLFVSVRDIIEHPTIAELAVCIQALEDSHRQESGTIRLLPFMHNSEEKTDREGLYPEVYSLDLPLCLSLKELENMLSVIYATHSAFRLSFGGDPSLQTAELTAITPESLTASVSVIEDQESNEQITAIVESLVGDYSLTEGRLIQLKGLRREKDCTVFIAAHRRVMDFASWNILKDNLMTLALQIANGQKLTLKRPVETVDSWSTSVLSEKEHKEDLAGPSDVAVPEMLEKGDSQKRTHFTLTAQSSADLLAGAGMVFNMDIDELLLAAWVEVMGEHLRVDNIPLMLEMTGRHVKVKSKALERTIGNFDFHYPLIIAITEGADIESNALAVKEQLRKFTPEDLRRAFEHPIMPGHFIGFSCHRKPELINYSSLFSGDYEQEKAPFRSLDISWDISGEHVCCAISYGGQPQYEKAFMQWVNDYQNAVERLIKHCCHRLSTRQVFDSSADVFESDVEKLESDGISI